MEYLLSCKCVSLLEPTFDTILSISSILDSPNLIYLSNTSLNRISPKARGRINNVA